MGGVVAWVEWETWSDLSVLSGELHGHRRPSVSPSATNVYSAMTSLWKSQIIPVKGRSFPSEIWMRAVSLSFCLSISLVRSAPVFISPPDGVLSPDMFHRFFVDFPNAFLRWLNIHIYEYIHIYIYIYIYMRARVCHVMYVYVYICICICICICMCVYNFFHFPSPKKASCSNPPWFSPSAFLSSFPFYVSHHSIYAFTQRSLFARFRIWLSLWYTTFNFW